MKDKKKLSPELKKIDDRAKVINYEITQARMKRDKKKVKALKNELLMLDMKANELQKK